MFYYFMICEFDQNFYLIVSIGAIWKFKSNAFVLCTMHVPYSQIILHKGKKTPIGLQTKELYNLLKSKNLDARYMETLEKMWRLLIKTNLNIFKALHSSYQKKNPDYNINKTWKIYLCLESATNIV